MASVDLPLRLVIVLEFLKTMYLFTTDFNCEAIANYFLCCERGDMAMRRSQAGPRVGPRAVTLAAGKPSLALGSHTNARCVSACVSWACSLSEDYATILSEAPRITANHCKHRPAWPRMT